jgi:hypothetical protein
MDEMHILPFMDAKLWMKWASFPFMDANLWMKCASFPFMDAKLWMKCASFPFMDAKLCYNKVLSNYTKRIGASLYKHKRCWFDGTLIYACKRATCVASPSKQKVQTGSLFTSGV